MADKMREVIKDPKFIDAYFEGVLSAIEDFKVISKTFYKALNERNFNDFETKLIVLDKKYDFSVSSAITMSYDFEGKDLGPNRTFPPSLYLTIFPQDNKTFVLLTFQKINSEFFNFLDRQLINLKENEMKERLSKLVLFHCENAVYSPRLISKMSNEEKNTIVDIFQKTLYYHFPKELMLKPLGVSLFKD